MGPGITVPQVRPGEAGDLEAGPLVQLSIFWSPSADDMAVSKNWGASLWLFL